MLVGMVAADPELSKIGHMNRLRARAYDLDRARDRFNAAFATCVASGCRQVDIAAALKISSEAVRTRSRRLGLGPKRSTAE